MKNLFPTPSRFFHWLAGAVLAATGLCAVAPARADANLEPLTNILSVPGSVGLGALSGALSTSLCARRGCVVLQLVGDKLGEAEAEAPPRLRS